MHLYILAQQIRKDIEVVLENGCEPSVGGYRRASDVEPAIWFKVMVLDAVTVDCDARRLSWIPLCDGFLAQDSGIAMSDSYRFSEDPSAAGRQLIGFSDDSIYCRLDEVFEAIPMLVSKYHTGAVTRDEFNEQMMGLLHVHILPSIRLSYHDMDSIKMCITSQEGIVRQTDCKILAVVDKQNSVVQSMSNLRKKLLNELVAHDGKSVSSIAFPSKLLEVLLSDVAKDIDEVWNSVKEAQAEVERAKESPDDAILLARRVHRDAINTEYEKLLAVREKLKEKLNSPKHTKTLAQRLKGALTTPQTDPLHDVYIGMSKKVDEYRTEFEQLTTKKLLMISVKEAARGVLDDIVAGNDVSGTDVDCIGLTRATDVLDVKTPWKSLAEQIAAILENPGDQISNVHLEFCRLVIDRCAAAVKEKQFFDAAKRRSGGGHDSARSSTISGGSNNVSVSAELEVSQWNSSVEYGSNRIFDPLSSTNSHDSDTISRSFSISPAMQESLIKNTLAATRSVSEVSARAVIVRKNANRKSNKVHSLHSHSGSLGPSFRTYVADIEKFGDDDHDSVSSSSTETPVIVFDINRDLLRKTMDSIRNDVSVHFETICRALETRFTKFPCSSRYQQIWLEYETHFYVKCLNALLSVYTLQYSNITSALCESLLKLTPADLDLQDAALVNLLRDDFSDDDTASDGATLRRVPEGGSNAIGQCSEAPSNSDVRSNGTLPADCQSSFKSYLTENGVDGTVNETVKSRTLATDRPDDETSSVIRRFRSENRTHQRFRTVRISLPVVMHPNTPTSVLVYERLLSPLPQTDENVPSTFFPSGLTSDRFGSFHARNTMSFMPKYQQLFASSFKCIDRALRASTLIAKLRFLRDCVNETLRHVREFYEELYGMPSSAYGCDELLDALVIVLCNVDGAKLAELYCQLMLLTDMMASWLACGPCSYTLVQFVGACQFIQERLVLKRNRTAPGLFGATDA